MALALIIGILPIKRFSSNGILIYSNELLIPEPSTFHFLSIPLVYKHADISSPFMQCPSHCPLSGYFHTTLPQNLAFRKRKLIPTTSRLTSAIFMRLISAISKVEC
jgi:hypothetical protein